MLYQALSNTELALPSPAAMPDTPGITIAEAAARYGVPRRTLIGWVRSWPIGRLEPRGWLITDLDLLAEMVDAHRERRLHAPLGALQKRPPQPAPEPQVDPSRTSLTTREAAALLETSEQAVLKFCESIAGFGSRPHPRAPWRIDAGMLACVGAVRQAAGGRMPLGALVRETERHHRLMAHTLHALRTPAAIEQLAQIAAQRIKAVRPDEKKRPRTDPTAPAAGEVRHGRR